MLQQPQLGGTLSPFDQKEAQTQELERPRKTAHLVTRNHEE
jgi:hypothetical protein